MNPAQLERSFGRLYFTTTANTRSVIKAVSKSVISIPMTRFIVSDHYNDIAQSRISGQLPVINRKHSDQWRAVWRRTRERWGESHHPVG